jgi:hypothetical protein
VAWLAFLCYKNKKARRMRAGDVMTTGSDYLDYKVIKIFVFFVAAFIAGFLGLLK